MPLRVDQKSWGEGFAADGEGEAFSLKGEGSSEGSAFCGGKMLAIVTKLTCTALAHALLWPGCSWASSVSWSQS